MVPATPAQLQFSHARCSPPRQGFHLRAPRHLSHADCCRLTFAPAQPPSAPPGAREAQGASSGPRPSGPGGAAAPRVKGATGATPTGCVVTAPGAEAACSDRCSRPFLPSPPGQAQVSAHCPGAPPPASARTTCRYARRAAGDGRPARLLMSGQRRQPEVPGGCELYRRVGPTQAVSVLSISCKIRSCSGTVPRPSPFSAILAGS